MKSRSLAIPTTPTSDQAPDPPFRDRARSNWRRWRHQAHIRLPDPFASQDVLLAPIYSLALLHTSRPFAFTLHDLQEHYYPENFLPVATGLAASGLPRVCLPRARRVICESQHVKSDIIRFFGVPAERTAVIPAPPLRQFLVERATRIAGGTWPPQSARLFCFIPAQFWPHKNHLR